MENREPQIFMNPEIKRELNDAEQKVEEKEALIAKAEAIFKDSIKMLEDCTHEIEHMNESNEFANEYNNKLGKHSGAKTYSEDVVVRNESNIKIAKKNVADANVLIASFTLDSIEAKADKEKLERLNQKFKDDLLKLESFNLN